MAIDKNTSWEGVPGTEIEQFIKKSFANKAGAVWHDSENSRYLLFADNDTLNEYIASPKPELIIGEIATQSNYLAKVTVLSSEYKAVQFGSLGNEIHFVGSITNLLGIDTGEAIDCVYTIQRNNNKTTVRERHKSGDEVVFNLDTFLLQGSNEITIEIEGISSHARATAIVRYDVVELIVDAHNDIAQVYDLSTGVQTMAVPFSVKGNGTKRAEWYVDGVKLAYNKNEDEIVESSTERTKYISLKNLSQGTHSLQLQVMTTIGGESFGSDIVYREFMVYTRANRNVITAIAQRVPSSAGIQQTRKLWGVRQYLPYELTFASYTPTVSGSSEIEILLGGDSQGNVTSVNGVVNKIEIYGKNAGVQSLVMKIGDAEEIIPVDVSATDMNIGEITDALTLSFNANGRVNNSANKDQWSYGDYTGTFEGFNWNNTSGWVDGSLYINAGAKFSIDYAPLANNPTEAGKTIELEFSSVNVNDDNAILCDLRNAEGVGLVIRATRIELISGSGVKIEHSYKDGEVVRMGIVINKAEGVTNQHLSMIYVNGIVSRCASWSPADTYTSLKELSFEGSEKAEMQLLNLNIYDTALSNTQMLNNYIFYRRNVSALSDAYFRNDIYSEDGTIDIDKASQRLPVMIVTGNVNELEETSDKNLQIVVDIEYINKQNPELSFTLEGAAMRPQGTSSMGYPKKNFRIYTMMLDSTILRDYMGNIVESRLYSFSKGAQPVNCWCLKADYAESSGTHNTGIARLWNSVLYNANIEHTNILGETVDGYVLRTEAQNSALKNNYAYDVRTTIDGFPILLFYHRNENEPLIFLGKYNFNNDKSTPSVFGFEGIPGFDNSEMQCWEVLNNGNSLALFTDNAGFDEQWSEAFESRYPDTKRPNISYLRSFCAWMTNVTAEAFVTEKWQHLDVYKVAAYYVYLMRFGAVDQTVKNAMFTSEDGEKWYYINYDNDTINGLINTGHLVAPWNMDRTTRGADGEPYYAGKDSRLWNMLEADEEFMQIVSVVDEALYIAGLRYDDVINVFDIEQAGKWVESIYNQDAQYKYISPFTDKGINNLFMLQGDREVHRKHWLARRFSLYDSLFVSGAYKAQSIEIKCIDNTIAGQKFTIEAGTAMNYGYGINNIARKRGISLAENERYTFTTEETINRGDPIRIYAAPNLQGLDLSAMSDRLAVITIDKVKDEALGTKFKTLIIGNAVKDNVTVADISGLAQAEALEYLDVRRMKAMTSLDLSMHKRITYVDARGSNIANIEFAKGGTLQTFRMPAAMQTLRLEQLPYLAELTSENNFMTVRNIIAKNCPYLTTNFSFVREWYMNTQLGADALTLDMTGVEWRDTTAEDLIMLGNLKKISVKGKAYIDSVTDEQIEALRSIYGEYCFDPESDFRIIAPGYLVIEGDNEVAGDDTIELKAVTFAETPGVIEWSVIEGSNVTVEGNGLTCRVIPTEDTTDREIVVQATHTPIDNGEVVTSTKRIKVLKVVRATSGSIDGASAISNSAEYVFIVSPTNVNRPYSVEWSIEGYAVDNGYVALRSQNNESCQVDVIQKAEAKFDVVATVNNGVQTYEVRKSVEIGVKLTLLIYTNQPEDEDIFANTKATVKYGTSSTTMGNGDELKLTPGMNVTITFDSVPNYKTPDTIEFVAGGDDVVKTGTYLAERVAVVLRAVDGGDLSGASVSINGTSYIWNGSPLVAKVAYNQSYNVEFNGFGTYIAPAVQTFTASQKDRLVEGVYDALPEDLIIIDQTISDPATMISGAVNNDVIQEIRANSHRYLGKYTAEGEMTLCQLDDNDSNKYADGSSAILTGAEGDVYMKMPDFWYRSMPLSTDVWGLQFRMGVEQPEGSGWNRWDGNALIGVYEAYSEGEKLYSRSDVESSGGISQANFKAYARNRGNGFRIVDWQMHCVMAILFYVQYGHTNSQDKIGRNTSVNTKQCGQTNANGMNDTKGTFPVSGLNDTGVSGNNRSINFWGLENWWGNKYEWIDNVVVNSYNWEITEPNGTVRKPGKASTSNGFIYKMIFGDCCDLIPTMVGGGEKTGFCDYYSSSNSSSLVVVRSNFNNYANGGVVFLNTFDVSLSVYSSHSSRLAFRGRCVIENNTTTFRSLTAIG